MSIDTGTPKKFLIQATAFAAALLAAVIAITMSTKGAKAAGPAPWSGCGLGIHGGAAILSADTGAGFSNSVNGQMLGGSALCDIQMGSFVVGGFAEYDRLFGDIFNQGAKTDMTLGMLGGYLIQPATLLYVHTGRAWYDTSFGTYQGWKVGAGTEIRLPTTAPLFADVRYTHHYVDSHTDVSADSIRIGLTLKFGTGLGSVVPAPAPLK